MVIVSSALNAGVPSALLFQSVLCSIITALCTVGASQVNEHFYILPAEVDAMLDATGFDVESVHGGFEREPFDEDESIHVVYAARKRG